MPPTDQKHGETDGAWPVDIESIDLGTDDVAFDDALDNVQRCLDALLGAVASQQDGLEQGRRVLADDAAQAQADRGRNHERVENQNAELQKAGGELEQQRDELKRQKQALQAERGALETEQCQLETQKGELQSQHQDLDDRQRAWQADCDAVSAERQAYQEQGQAIQEQQQALQADREALGCERDALQADLRALEQQRKSLEEGRATLAADRDALEELCGELSDQQAAPAESVESTDMAPDAREQPEPTDRPVDEPLTDQAQPSSEDSPQEQAALIAEPAAVDEPDPISVDLTDSGTEPIEEDQPSPDEGGVDLSQLDEKTLRKLKVLRRLAGSGKTDAQLLAQIQARGAAEPEPVKSKRKWWGR